MHKRGNLALAGYEDIFGGTLLPSNSMSITMIPLSNLHPPDFHPFGVNDDTEMDKLVLSVKQHGVREPGLARPRPDGGYELLCGNRRKRACELVGLPDMPVVICVLSDGEATIVMVDSNLLHRERILPSEKAWACQMKLDALNHNGIKGEKHSVDILAEQTGESRNQIYRLVRLTELIVTLLDMVDTRQLAFNPAVELSYLSVPDQTAVAEAMAKFEVKPSLSQAVRIRKMKQSGELTAAGIDRILSEEKKPPKEPITGYARYRKYFPTGYSPKQMDTVIIKLLSDWQACAE